jgi:hypothetical protein
MTPLIQAPSVIPQLILSLCTVSIATCNKLFENMTLFNGDHKDTKIIGTVNGKSFYWKIDTGSAVTCMNINAFETAFGKTKEKNMKECKTDIFIRNRKCTHTVKIADESSENILGIDFLQKIPATLGPQDKGDHLSIGTLQSTIRYKKFHDTSFCHHSGTSQNLPEHRPSAALHRGHRRSKAALDIRTFNTGQF